MKQNFKRMQPFIAAFLCVFLSVALNSCSDDDDPSPAQGIVGEWLEEDGDIYYNFSSDGEVCYIYLPDEPGYNPAHPETTIKNPADPSYYEYTIEGNILTIKDERGNNVTDYDEYEIDLTQNTLAMRKIRYMTTDKGTFMHDKWIECDGEWEYYNRWSAPK